MRWREALTGVASAIVGLWWLVGKGTLFLLPGAALAVGGLALIWIGFQRARFRSEGDGPGSVQVDEGQIAYFGPLTGGVASLQELTQITLDSTLHPTHWRLRQAKVAELLIPVNADGADRLFDAFATLPGFHMEQTLSALRAQEKHSIVIWKREQETTPRVALH